MERHLEHELESWLSQHPRKPLVLRGARQVGKTWLVRQLALRHGRQLVELNFERDERWRSIFASNDPRQVMGDLAIQLGQEFDPKSTLLFLDEVQAAPEVFAKLRWFAEELAELPVIAAGSLLELLLGEHTFSMPVGRIGYRHVEPMGFVEFMNAHDQGRLLRALADWSLETSLSATVHQRATQWHQRYAMVGGMPEVVAMDTSGASPRACRDSQRELVATFRDDFSKYERRVSREMLDSTLSAVVRGIGGKFVYSHVGEGVKHAQAKRAVELLADAKLCSFVNHTGAHGLPLSGEERPNIRKVLLLDIGLLHARLDTPASTVFPQWEQLAHDVRGRLAEQLAGQALRLLQPTSGDGPRLHYWQREGGRAGEVDYVIQVEGRIVPVELKSGASGAMKSLHQFVADRRLGLAVRCDANPPSSMSVDVKTTVGDQARYRLLSLPLYLLHRLPELIAEMK